MKIRLSITNGSDQTTTFESAGPIVRIGKDPEFELSLTGEAARSVSYHHARIEFVEGNVLLVDTESSNGTLVNNRPIKEPTPLRIKDQFRLGFTGPLITVLDLEKLQPPQSQPPVSKPVPPYMNVALALLGLVVLLGAMGLWFLFNGGKPEKPPDPERVLFVDDNKQQNLPPKVSTPNPTVPPPVAGPETIKPPPTPPVNPKPVPVLKETPRSEVKEIGRHVSLPKWGPSLLLQRQGEAYPWIPVRAEGPVYSSYNLVCLPGYRSIIALGSEDPARARQNPKQDSWVENGVQLGLWGNVPEFSGFPPVLESAVMLNIPTGDADLDVILERGRIHISHKKKAGPAKVKLRFLREAWDVTLLDGESEVCAELFTPDLPDLADPRLPPQCLVLFNKGKVRLQTSKQTLDLTTPSRVVWLSAGDGQVKTADQPMLPDWWAKSAGAPTRDAADAMLSLIDWEKELASSAEVLDTIMTKISGSKDVTFRMQGLLFLSAINAQNYLVEFLEDATSSQVRGAAVLTLRAWLGQNPQYAPELVRIIKERKGFSNVKAQKIVDMIPPIPKADRDKPETIQRLIDDLNHDNLAVRLLAFSHLGYLLPESQKTILYDPVEPKKEAIEQYRKFIPAGKRP